MVKPRRSNGNNSSHEYDVERVVDMRSGFSGVEYLIKWQGWSEEENTWEPENHLQNCKQLLNDFYQGIQIEEVLDMKENGVSKILFGFIEKYFPG
jgi:hypothetical protein